MSVSKKKWRLAIGACAVMVIAATAWAQQESRKMLEEWLSLSKKGREEYKAQMDPWQLREHTKSYAGLVPYCGKCLGICPVKRGKHPFKKRVDELSSSSRTTHE